MFKLEVLVCNILIFMWSTKWKNKLIVKLSDFTFFDIRYNQTDNALGAQCAWIRHTRLLNDHFNVIHTTLTADVFQFHIINRTVNAKTI